MRTPLRLTLLVTFVLPTLACGDVVDKLLDCENESPADPAFESTQLPDWEGTIEATPDAPFLGLTSGTIEVQVWDCVDMSWVADVPEQKVIQAFVDDNDCFYAEAVVLETAPCGSTDTDDIPYRDMDGDGFSPAEGDPDDTDPTRIPTEGDEDSGGVLSDGRAARSLLE